MKRSNSLIRRAAILTTALAGFIVVIVVGIRKRPVEDPSRVAADSSAVAAASPVAEVVPDADGGIGSVPIAPQKYVNGGVSFRERVPEGLSRPEWDSIRGQIEDSEYAFQVGPGADRADAANREQRIKASLGRSGIRVTPYAAAGEEPAWHWRLQVVELGVGAEKRPVEPATEVSASGRRAEVRRGLLTEWCENENVGVEQGFTIHEAPAGIVDSDGGLRLDFNCETSLKAVAVGATTVQWGDDSGEVVLRYSGLYAYDANAVPVPAKFEFPADEPGRLCIALRTEGAVYPITIDPLIATKEQKLEPLNPASETQFGFAVAMQGGVCVIGSPPDDPAAVPPATGGGAVYVYIRNSVSGAWQQSARIGDPVANSNRAFGAAIDWSGDTLVIGAPAFEDSGAPVPADAVGAYIMKYVRGYGFLPGAATPLSDPDGASQSSGFGESVAISGTGEYVAVGSPRADHGGAQSGGRVLIYPRMGNGSYPSIPSALHDTWGGHPVDYWGKSLSFDKRGDSLLAVGSPGFNQPGYPNGGRASVLTLSAGGLVEAPVEPVSPGYQFNGRFGASVGICGGRLAVGHPGAAVTFTEADGSTTTNSVAGVVHVFDFGGPWAETAAIRAPDPQLLEVGFGSRISLDDENLVINTEQSSYGFALQWYRWVPTFRHPDISFGFGHFPTAVSGDQVLFGETGEIFRLQGNGWCRLTPELLAAADPGERRGMVLAGSRDFMVAGSPFYSPPGQDHRGRVSVVLFTPSGQPLLVPLDTGAPAGAEAGSSVATDGQRIAVGAPGQGGGSGAVSIYERNSLGNWIEINGVANPDTAAGAGDRFGSAIAIDGDRLVVGAALDGQYGFWAGRAWVFQRDPGGSWANPVELVPPPTAGSLGAFDLFGWAVDIEGDRIVVSEPGDDDAGSGAGAVHVFEWRGTLWSWIAKATPEPGDFAAGVEVNLGFSLALDGDRIAAGAPAPVISPGSGPGSVSIFARMAGGPAPGGLDSWGRIARIVPGNSANDDEFGLAVQWQDDELIVGGGQTDTIHVFTGANGGEDWREQSRIHNPLGTTGEGFGHSFAVTGNELAAGVPFANLESGELVFFRRPGGWHPAATQQWQDTGGLGSALAIDADTGVFGAERYTIPGSAGSEQGGVYVIGRNPAGQWNIEGDVLTAQVAQTGARFGAAVAIRGDRIVVGAPAQDGAGGAWAFTRQHNGAWLVAEIPAVAIAGDQFGASVDLDGRFAVIGAPFNAVHGKAYVYRFDVGTLGAFLQKTLSPPASPPQGVTSADARFGASVSLDGNTLAVGAPGFDLILNPDSGAAFLFDRNRGGLEQWGLVKTVDGLPSSVPSGFGESLDLSEDWLVVGAPGYAPSPSVASGAAHLLRRGSGGVDNWGREQILLPETPEDGMDFGQAVAISDEWIAVGVPGMNIGAGLSGAVEMFLFGRLDTSPVGRGMLLAGISHNSQRFGSAVALGGRTLLVGDNMAGGPPGWGAVEVFMLADHRERWGFDNFGTSVFDPVGESSLWGDFADADGDGLDTILEYLMGTDPNAAQPSVTNQAPILANGTVGGRFLRLRFRQAPWAAESDYSMVPEWSFDLQTWYRSGNGPVGGEKTIEQVVVMADGDGSRSWIVDALLDVSNDEPQAYLRLVAEKQGSGGSP